ncbi:GTPase Era [Amphiplicatus metriothermophilus]|uniref:GTPase Era n=1 Tax=Amphiplicatus metriothermophilus TaxID=1519374 RepID=A0A239PQ88_9PROT|nr:GTPase Era [Amphiplicatus metriothermophilus]MBB5518769.1 GTP-binding protein Era [Amphiplicatus metriothermophilus]SNT72076.1 GTP-binding protein Era [Amphiplicatus metriothermophilus]
MTETRCAFVAVIGAPNAGKSTLVNAMVGAKVSIVTHKVQTTRARVRGVAIHDETQLVFIDTPGIFSPRRRLDRAMVAAAWDALEGADVILLMVDAPAYRAGKGGAGADAASRRAVEDTDAIVAGLKERGAKAVLVLNKIDRIARGELLALIDAFNAHGVFTDVFLISATTGDGILDLKAFLAKRAPQGPWMYPEDQLSDNSERLMAAEVTREKIYLRLHQELPYETTVETESWTRTGKGGIRIEQTIYVARESQKPIVLGKGGQTLKAIGAAARRELTELLGVPVHLFLHVKVKENWAEDPARYRAMGLDVAD